MSDALTGAYRAIPYPGDAYLRTHPRHVAAVAHLHGVELPPIGGWRVLDLGCADGGNALAIADDLPGSEVLGIDLEPEAVARGEELVRAAGLRNVTLRAADLMTLDPDELGTFDLVIAHGLLSWVPDDVRRHALRLIRTVLRRRTGVAFVSFNAGPVRERLRARLLPALSGIDEPRARLRRARELLADDAIAGGDPAVLRHVGALRSAPDHLLAHDDLGTYNTALTQVQVQREAGLRVLGDAGLASFDPDASHQQLLLLNGRRSLAAPDERRLSTLQAGAMLHVDGDAFRTPDGGVVRTGFAPLGSALGTLAAAWPGAVPVADLDPAAGPALLQAAGHGVVKLVTEAPVVTADPGPRPRATALARAQAARDGRAVNRWHRTIALRPAEARLLTRLDGTHEVRPGDAALRALAAAGLLVA